VSGVLTPGQFFKVLAAWLAIAAAVFVLAMSVSGKVETRGVEWASPWRVLTLELRGHHLAGAPLAEPDDQADFNVLEQRLPRVIAAGIVGTALAAAGVTLQALLRNPLADPYVLGISSGSTVGVMLWLLIPTLMPGLMTALPSILVTAGPSIPAVAGALLTCVLVFVLARGAGGAGGGMQPVTLLLVGVVISSMNAAVLMVLNSLAPHGLKSDMASFMLGSISEGALTPGLLAVAAVVLLVGYVPTLLAAYALNIGTLSDTEATSLGINIQRLRVLCFVCASIMTGAAILLSGPIGFVGLICPHICRRLKWIGGADHRILMIAAPLCGAAFLMLADSVVRVGATLNKGLFPVGVVTALCGGPFFLYLLKRGAAR